MNKTEERIWSNPKFQNLVRSRNRFLSLLFALTLISFFGFAFIAIFAPAIFGIPLWQGAATPVGVPFGVIVMTLPCLLTGIYMIGANLRFDSQIEEILRDAESVSEE
ncbi:MAG: DUF485 domain-containing protein [Gammaproteobacteria bacterium]|nr:DUF485 domain-containing protein [Gammaproteobacteria bacterium]